MGMSDDYSLGKRPLFRNSNGASFAPFKRQFLEVLPYSRIFSRTMKAIGKSSKNN